MREWQLFALNYYNSDIFIQKYCEKDSFVLLVHGSFGDIYFALALLKSFNDTYKTNINIIIDVKYKNLASKYQYDFCKYLFVDNINSIAASLQTKNQKYLLCPGLIYPTLPTCHPLICEAILTERMNDTEARRLILGIPAKIKFDKGLSFENDLKTVENFFEYNKLIKNKTVIISPVTNTFKIDVIHYYKTLAYTLKKLGFTILINISQDKNNLKDFFIDFICTEIEPHLLFEYSNYASFHIISFNGLYSIHTLFENTARIITIKDARNETIVSNGISINIFSCSASTVIEDVNKNNDLTELNIISNFNNMNEYIIQNWIFNSHSTGLKVIKI